MILPRLKFTAGRISFDPRLPGLSRRLELSFEPLTPATITLPEGPMRYMARCGCQRIDTLHLTRADLWRLAKRWGKRGRSLRLYASLVRLSRELNAILPSDYRLFTKSRDPYPVRRARRYAAKKRKAKR